MIGEPCFILSFILRRNQYDKTDDNGQGDTFLGFQKSIFRLYRSRWENDVAGDGRRGRRCLWFVIFIAQMDAMNLHKNILPRTTREGGGWYGVGDVLPLVEPTEKRASEASYYWGQGNIEGRGWFMSDFKSVWSATKLTLSCCAAIEYAGVTDPLGSSDNSHLSAL